MESPCHDPEDVPGQRPRDGGSPAAQSELRRKYNQTLMEYSRMERRDTVTLNDDVVNSISSLGWVLLDLDCASSRIMVVGTTSGGEPLLVCVTVASLDLSDSVGYQSPETLSWLLGMTDAREWGMSPGFRSDWCDDSCDP